MKKCSEIHCQKPYYALGFCINHYQSKFNAGLIGKRREPYSDARFWQRIDQSGGVDACWPWKNPPKSSRYIQFKMNGKAVSAHRHCYEITFSKIPDNMLACHKCDNPICCNPNHIFIGTSLDNVRDKIAKGRDRYNQGSKVYCAKLSEEQVLKIRYLHSHGMPQYKISPIFNISRGSVWDIIHGKTWKHLL